MLASLTISPSELWSMLGTAQAPQLIDLRRRELCDSTPGVLPTSIWREAGEVRNWAPELDRTHPIVAACKAGHERGQLVAAALRAEGIEAAGAGRRLPGLGQCRAPAGGSATRSRGSPRARRACG